MENLNVDMLLDSEINKIQEDILGSQSNEEKTPTEAKPEQPKVKKLTKSELVEQYIKLGSAANVEIESEARIKRMTKTELTKKIAELMNRELGGASYTPAEEFENPFNEPPIGDTKEHPRRQPQVMSPEQLNLVAEGLFQMNAALCSLFESGSHAIKSKTYNVALLENWTQNVYNKKTELVCIFKQMYVDYKDVFDKYLSPMVQWTMIMIQTGTITVFNNLKKKKESSKEELE